MPSDPRTEAALLHGLVPPDLQELYQTSPTFHFAIRELIAMLPAMVIGLSIEARNTDGRLAALAEVARTAPLLGEADARRLILDDDATAAHG